MPDQPILSPEEAAVAAYQAEQAKEYGQYVAAEVITIGGARAFNVGDPVPASHVARGVVGTSQVTAVSSTKES